MDSFCSEYGRVTSSVVYVGHSVSETQETRVKIWSTLIPYIYLLNLYVLTKWLKQTRNNMTTDVLWAGIAKAV
jgi:hypothetical protein